MQNLAQEQSGIMQSNLQSLGHFWPKSIHIIVAADAPLMAEESAAAGSHQKKKQTYSLLQN